MVLLNKDLWFPEVSEADADGLLAIGGDLSVDRLMLAYRSGIFPWFMEQGFIFWYSPSERMVLYPDEIIISHSMKKIISQQKFTITTNQNFELVIENCARVHTQRSGSTWINRKFVNAYKRMHRQGFAKSIEVWESNELVGGLYGVETGDVFCGESMFSKKANASKLAFIYLSQQNKYRLIDCQVYNPHLASMGARLISRNQFGLLLQQPTK